MTYYKVKGYQELLVHSKNGKTYERKTLIDNELLTGNQVLRLGFSVHDLPSFLEKVYVKKVFRFFGARFEDED